MGVTVLCAAFSVLLHGVSSMSSCLDGASLHIDIDMFLASLSVLVYFVDFHYLKNTEEITKISKLTTVRSWIGKVVLEGRRKVLRSVSAEEPASRKQFGTVDDGHDGSGDPLGHKRHRSRSDMHTIERARRESVSHTLPSMLKVMHAAIRLGHGEAAVTLFDQMLEKGAVPGAHLIHKAVSNRFFQLVAGTLDDKRVQIDGLRLLDLVRVHGIHASVEIQNRLLAAWRDRQLPESVVEYFVKMKSAGTTLSKWACRSIIVAYERSDPELVLKMCNEMEGSGIQL
ncbi:unnamed protein product [Prorocentrum cordatum]|uniref:Pentatricopeptide repeat-containing protein n=1 Tax=Prorocentrum cordatum TaxID=2364126 RepID=A0ABN9XK72_9DINO|nr:unnamed protein product [Polarella glacialis]